MKLKARLELFPPIMVRLLAQKQSKPLSTAQIALTGSLPEPVVEALSRQVTWDNVTLGQMFQFFKGCNIDLTEAKDIRRITDYIRKNPNFEYLRRSEHWKNYYLPLLRVWRRSWGTVENRTDLWLPMKHLLVRLNPLLTIYEHKTR